jgi:hypothetical protein
LNGVDHKRQSAWGSRMYTPGLSSLG